MLFGNIKINVYEGQVVVESEKDKTVVSRIVLSDDYYENDVESQLKNLMGQCMECLVNLSSEQEMVDMVEDCLDDWNSNYNVELKES